MQISTSNRLPIVACHLRKINPKAQIITHVLDVHDNALDEILANVDWMIVGTDNHASRLRAQQMSHTSFTPLITAGVNITVDQDGIQDMSGEIIVIRPGDHLCLECLQRINHMKVAVERSSDTIAYTLVSRGYVEGRQIHEPAVKTLNACVASLTVEQLLNQYTGRQEHIPILVYENNRFPTIYPDTTSVENRNLECFSCHLGNE